MGDKEDKTVRQYVLFCRTALMYEKKNYYNERKHRAESGNVTEQVVDVSKDIRRARMSCRRLWRRKQ